MTDRRALRTQAKRAARLRPARSDDLGLRRAFSDRLLPVLVGAMAFLAALALAGVVAAAGLAEHWQRGAAAALTVQVPDPDTDQRLARVLDTMRGTPGVLEARALPEAELQALLRPWLGSGEGRIAMQLPAVVAVRLGGAKPGDASLDAAALEARLNQVAPGTLLESQDVWIRRLSVLARSLQACAALAMGVVGFVAVAVVMVATRAGLSSRRNAIEIVHGLGATDGFIAGRFADRATRLAASGALAGAAVALPVLLRLTGLAAPFAGGEPPEHVSEMAAAMPGALWMGLPALPLVAAVIGWVTAQVTVRRWLRRLP